MSEAIISGVRSGSPASHSDMRVGDRIVEVNGQAPTDILDFQRLIDGPRVELTIVREDSPIKIRKTISKLAGDSLGITVESAVFDRIRTCDNHCSFCFIYQLPKQMRKSLYVKDDDYRLSFLYGNFTTLTRFTEFDVERVIEEGLSPLYVSIHTTNPQLRAEMLRNPRGATSLRWLEILLSHNVAIHGQVVLCPGINDGAELRRTLEDVATLYPSLMSLSIVPVGVSRFSTESTMRPYSPGEARDVIAVANSFGNLLKEKTGRRLVHVSDEFYLVAGMELPPLSHYDDFDETENGIGMVRQFESDFQGGHSNKTLGSGFFQSVDGAPASGYRSPRASVHRSAQRGPLRILTGLYAEPILKKLISSYPFVDVVAVENQFFGGNISVAGLMTGNDIRRVMNEHGGGAQYVIPDVCLSEGRFIDDVLLSELPFEPFVIATSGGALRTFLDSVVEGTP